MTSNPSSEPILPSRPKILIDHSLGRVAIPAFFRSLGYETTTILEMFGRTDVRDVDWIEEAGRAGLVVAHKDARIRYRPAERQAVLAAKLRMLCLTSGNLTAQDQVEYFRTNMAAIEKWWPKPGPWILAVRRTDVKELPLRD
ncbi:MAG: hypothetical protein FWD80_05480 [Propionibacteriaceae bacterium]|nr:hypothetical protein [Propionibacteriaceae bacterium]